MHGKYTNYTYSIIVKITVKPWEPAGIFVGGSEPQKCPPQDEKAPPPKKKKIVLAPFLGGSEACSPEKKLTVVLPTTF